MPGERPILFEYSVLSQYIADMLRWKKMVDRAFSIRKETARLHRCSYGLVSAVVAGKRRLTLDRVDDFGKLLGLSAEERGFLRTWVANGGRQKKETKAVLPPKLRRKRRQNNLLSDWLNVYVKDVARVKGFQPDPEVIYRMLGGIASVSQIRRSLNFLFREGYLRKTLDGKIVENDVLVTTTDDEHIDVKITRIHRRALKIARDRITQYPRAMRRESLVVMPLNEKSVGELRELLKEFYERTLQFAEEHPADDEKLFQVIFNLCPIGG